MNPLNVTITNIIKGIKMSQKINLIMVVCGPNLMFQIDGTFDKVIFHHESEAALLIKKYLCWAKNTIDIIEFPDRGIGTNWHILDKGSIALYESLKDLLQDKYELAIEIPRDDFSDVYK